MPLMETWPYHSRMFKCSRNFGHIKSALNEYAISNKGDLPDKNHWCDILISFSRGDNKLTKDDFHCSFNKGGSSNYALNEALIGLDYSKLPDNTVILFEIERGWNKIGGVEDSISHDHNGHRIVFRDGDFRWISDESVNKLNWEGVLQNKYLRRDK